MSDLLAKHAGLPLHERAAYRVLAAHMRLPNRTQLLEGLRAVGARKVNGNHYRSTELCELLGRWRRLGLVQCTDDWQDIRCPFEVVDAALLDDELTPLENFCQQLAPQSYYSYAASPLQIRLALYLDDSHEVEKMIHSFDRLRRERDLLPQVLGPAPSAALLARVPEGLRDYLVNDCLVPNLLRGVEPSPGWLDFVAQTPSGLEECAAWLGAWALFCDKQAEFDWLVERYPEHPESLAVRSVAAALDGEVEQARRWGARALERARGDRKNKKPALLGPGGPWVAFALLTGSPEEREQARAAISALQHKKGRFTGTFVELQNLLDVVDQKPTVRQVAFSEQLDFATYAIFHALCACWELRPRASVDNQEVEHTKRLAAHLDHAGYVRLARELAQSARVHQGPAPSDWPLMRLCRAKEPWETVLEALESAAAGWGTGAAASAETEQRVLWRISVHGGNAFIEALIQKKTAKGFSPGRAVTTRKIRDLAASGELPENDRVVASHIKEFHDFEGASYRWDERTMLSLVGHPRVVNVLAETLEVVEGQPEVRIRQNKDGFELVARPPDAQKPGIFCEAEMGRLIVYRITEGHATVARALRKRIIVPQQQRARIERLAGQLARGVQLQSDLELTIAHATEEAADARPCVLLWRAPSGLRYRVVVQPLGESGPSYEPSEGETTVVVRTAEATRQARRDLARESELFRNLLDACPRLVHGVPEGRHRRLTELIDCYELLSELAEAKQECLVKWPEGNPLSIVGRRELKDLRIKLTSKDDWLQARVRVDLDEAQVADYKELMRRLGEARGRFIELDQDRVLAFSEQLLEKLKALDHLGVVRKDGVEVPALAASALDAWFEGIPHDQCQTVIDEKMADIRKAMALSPRVPQGLRATLRDYQLEGYRWMRRLSHLGAGALLCDDMGLGKTVQILALLSAMAKQGPSLIIAPTSLVHHWQDQARQFTPGLHLVLWEPSDRATQLENLGKGDVLLTTYGVLQRAGATLSARRFAVAVLDEAQAIKNASTARARSAHSIAADFRIVSTGTPIENHLGELWSLMRFANPALLGSHELFLRRFARPIAEGSSRAAEILRQLVRPFLLRRTKDEVLSELPEKTELDLRIELDANERDFYEVLRQNAQERVARAEAAQVRMQVLAGLTRLRQAACHPKLISRDAPEQSAKHKAFYALIDELREGDHRALVFSQFVEHLSLIRKGLDARGVSYQYLDGSTPPAGRKRAVEDFQTGKGELFLISLRAGGSGLNLTAADYVIHLDPWWNPAVEAQASDRAHRIGQQRPVTIYRLIAAGTIEERILELHQHKRAAADQLLEGSSEAVPLDLDALRALLE